jgi:hypothetical protein
MIQPSLPFRLKFSVMEAQSRTVNSIAGTQTPTAIWHTKVDSLELPGKMYYGPPNREREERCALTIYCTRDCEERRENNPDQQ